MYRTSSKSPPVHLFFFGVQNRFFFCPAKEKVVLAPAGQAKNNCKIKHPSFPQKKRRFYPRGVPPPIRRRSTHRVRAVSNSRAVDPAGQAEKQSPAGQAATNKTEKASLFAEGKSRFVKFLCWADMISAPTNVRWLAEKRLPARDTPHP